MTDHEPLDPLDELASAHLDGLTTAEEAARVESDPELARRVSAMRSVRDALRDAVPPVDAATRERTIAAALSAVDGPSQADELTRARHRRAALRGRRVLGVAAALVLLALAVPVLGQLRGDDSEDLATSAADMEESSGEAGDDGAGADPTTTVSQGASAFDAEDRSSAAELDEPLRTPFEPVSLGELDDLDDLVVAARVAVSDLAAGGPAPATSQAEAATRLHDDCPGTALEPPAGATAVLRATAELDGVPVLVLVHDDPDGTRTIRVVSTAPACELVTERAL